MARQAPALLSALRLVLGEALPSSFPLLRERRQPRASAPCRGHRSDARAPDPGAKRSRLRLKRNLAQNDLRPELDFSLKLAKDLSRTPNPQWQ